MSHLFATALLLSVSAGSAGLLTLFNQPSSPQALNPIAAGQTLVNFDAPDISLGSYLSQAEASPRSEPDQSDQSSQPLDQISATVCVNLSDWQRPSDIAQIKQLESMPEYADALQSDPLSDMAKAWWSHEIFSFTTYGLSARTEPLYLSGVWTAMDHIWDCYDGDQAEQINQGNLAEIWLLNHQLVGLAWQDDQYIVTVEPKDQGLQLVQFPRRENNQTLPLQILTTTGQELAVMSGDW
ncbi:MAG: hypothetical protein AAFW95_04210 [Cyanobacteria bacterium J06638_6]